jgi:hypothetical protein
LCRETPWITLKKAKNRQDIKTKSFLFFIFVSLKIPLLHHAASFDLSVKGGRMVKEWDFEAIFGLFQGDPCCLPTQNWLKKHR